MSQNRNIKCWHGSGCLDNYSSHEKLSIIEQSSINMKNHIMKRVLDAALLVTLLGALTQTASALPSPLPDANSTAGLMVVAFGGLAVIRRFRR